MIILYKLWGKLTTDLARKTNPETLNPDLSVLRAEWGSVAPFACNLLRHICWEALKREENI